MIYKFTCEQCGSNEEKDIKLIEYTSEGYICSKCGGKLVRDISSFCTSSKWNCGGAYSNTNY